MQDARDLAAQEDQGHDGDDGNERKDQRVLGETLALLVIRDAAMSALIRDIEWGTSFP